MNAVSIALPTPDDVPPDAVLLKTLQKYAGEFNWLATRTRPDLAYFTSLIASSMKAHGEWSLRLCKKVLRYLLGTIEQGLVMKAIPSSSGKHVGSNTSLSSVVPAAPRCSASVVCVAPEAPRPSTHVACAQPEALQPLVQTSPVEPVAPRATAEEGESSSHDELWDPLQLVAYSDAGFGGVGTRAQTGVLVLWAGSPVLVRSSRQSVSALSTCEAEVNAAATAWICTEGIICLLEEWHINLKPPILLVDNKSALTLMRLGGSWRTRYFAIRAVRIMEEISRHRLQLRFCPTGVMAADGLTKLATAQVMDDFRKVLSGKPFEVPSASAEF